MVLKTSVKLARKHAKVDWYLRDLYVKTLDNIAKEGSIKDILEFQEYTIRKIRQDTSHFIFERKIAAQLHAAGYLVAFLESINGLNLGDLIAISREGKIYLIELKSGLPPWIINNTKEHGIYHEIYNNYNVNIVYVFQDWRKKDSPILATTFEHVGYDLDNEKIIVNRYWTFKELLLR